MVCERLRWPIPWSPGIVGSTVMTLRCKVFLTGVDKSGWRCVLSPEAYFDYLSQFTLFGLDYDSVEEKEYLVLAGWLDFR
jgi:hypothetical protein